MWLARVVNVFHISLLNDDRKCVASHLINELTDFLFLFANNELRIWWLEGWWCLSFGCFIWTSVDMNHTSEIICACQSDMFIISTNVSVVFFILCTLLSSELSSVLNPSTDSGQIILCHWLFKQGIQDAPSASEAESVDTEQINNIGQPKRCLNELMVWKNLELDVGLR